MATRPIIERKFIILRWHYKPFAGFKSAHSECYPVSEDVYPDFASAAKDVAEGQVEPLVQGVEIDLDAGTSRDITADLLSEARQIEESREESWRCGSAW